VEQRSQPHTGIPAIELQERRERLLEHLRRDGLSGYVLFGADYIQYFTGFWFLSNERPVIYAESVGGESAVFVPEFEVEAHARRDSLRSDRVLSGVPGD
jgi:Xaa-Pro dipeptidase